MRARLERTSCETSLMIFALSLGESVVNHFARRCGLGEPRPVRHFNHNSPLSPVEIGE